MCYNCCSYEMEVRLRGVKAKMPSLPPLRKIPAIYVLEDTRELIIE